MAESYKRKLIETSIPLEVINRESAREKSIRHGHPSTLHLWWARRPLAAARAVLFAQLVDDPASRPEEFPTEEAQKLERERLHDLISRLVVWENVRDERLLDEARAEILKSTDGNPPPILDPFAGGGTIPLEAQRLGLEAHASDLNPVAVLINKALIEFPPKFRDLPPVFPGTAESEIGEWKGAKGLAADVRAYGDWMRDEAQDRIGHLYPKADGKTVIAWIWARTVTCPNPACGIEMPLVRSWWLGKKKGKEAYVVPSVVADAEHPSGKRVEFSIGHDVDSAPTAATDGTVGRSGSECLACAASIDLKYVRQNSRDHGLGAQLMAVVAAGDRRRDYLAPNDVQANAAEVDPPGSLPEGEIFDWPGRINVYRYGMTKWSDLFTNRQLVALTTFSDLVGEARERVLQDALASGMAEGERLEAGGTGAAAYADTVAVYLGMTVARQADLGNALCRWEPNAECPRQLFARQAIPMVWDFAEGNPLGNSSGSWATLQQGSDRAFGSVAFTPADRLAGRIAQEGASTRSLSGFVISTDPPYYDNIGYSDLSDFFYVWDRRSLRGVLPSLFGTMLVPKAEELVANPYRHGGKDEAKSYFEDGFRDVFKRARESADDRFPMTVYYAFKQSESGLDGTASSGWETLLDGMVRGGWAITGTWPLRTETSSRMIAQGTNALASSIVLSLRPRPEGAPTTDRRGFIGALETELKGALETLQAGGIAPVDLPQAAIGPGMGVFSRYASVIEADGSPMTVRSALARINEVLDVVLNEQEGDFDPTTRFAIAWFKQHGYAAGLFGDADNVARARNTAVATLDRDGVLLSRAGKVSLIRPADLDAGYDAVTDDSSSVWEVTHHLIRILDAEGVGAAGAFLASASTRPDVESDLIPELGHLLFRVCEDRGWTKEAIGFNSLVTIWPDVLDASRVEPVRAASQSAFDFDDED